MTFDELIKDKKVAAHPLLKGYRNMKNVREAINKHAQDLVDEFSLEDANKRERKTDLRSLVHEASQVLQNSLHVFNFPIFPKVSYNNMRDVKYARHDTNQIVDGIVVFNVELRSVTGCRRLASISVPVSRGEVIPPSLIEVDGVNYVLAQKSIDEIVGRVTSYKLSPLRGQFDPPLTRPELESAVAVRNDRGWQPIDNGKRYLTRRAVRSVPARYELVVEEMKKAMKDGEDTFPRPYIYLLRNYILNHVSTADKNKWEVHLINDGWCLNSYGPNRGRPIHASKEADMEKEVELEIEPDSNFYPGTKTPIEPGDGVKFNTPSGAVRGTVVEQAEDKLIVKAKGVEYRVALEEVEPIPSTFKKMYL